MKRREKLAAKAAAGKLKSPNKLVYFPLIYLAVCADLLGILAQVINATGIGAIAVSLVSICISIFFFTVGIFLNSRIKATRRLGNEFSERISTTERRIKLLQQTSVRLARYVSRAARSRSSARTAWKRKLFVGSARKITTWTRGASRFFRYAQVVLEAIPFINMLPWFTINMVLIYRERRQEYQAAMETVAQFIPVDAQEDSAFADLEAADAQRIKSMAAFTA